MSTSELEYQRDLLQMYDTAIKSSIKKNKWNKIYLLLCLINTALYSFNVYSNILKDKSIIFPIITLSLWITAAALTYFLNIKRTTKLINENKEFYNNTLKIVDYPKYIKEQRAKKLKKLKIWHS